MNVIRSAQSNDYRHLAVMTRESIECFTGLDPTNPKTPKPPELKSELYHPVNFFPKLNDPNPINPYPAKPNPITYFILQFIFLALHFQDGIVTSLYYVLFIFY